MPVPQLTICICAHNVQTVRAIRTRTAFNVVYPSYYFLFCSFLKKRKNNLTIPTPHTSFHAGNQFGKQEPWEHERIAKFAQENYNVTFPIYEKINVNGAQTDPLYKMLKEELPGMLGSTSVKWNFTKFLCGRDGVPFKRYSSLVSPSKISSDIERLLKVDVGGATPILSPNARVVDEGDATEGDEACTLPQRTASN